MTIIFKNIFKYLTEDKDFYKRLLYLAIPIIIQDLISSTINTLDTVMISSLGISQLTAVGLSNQVFFLFSMLLSGITAGSGIFTGQFWGKDKNIANIHKTIGLSMSLSLILSIIFFIIAFFIPGTVMSIYSDGSTDVIDFGIEYLKTIGSSYFLTAITMSISVTLKSIGNPMIPMIASFAALFANALFNYIFIFVLNLSVYGAALSTVIARLLELIIIVIYILKLKIPIISSLNGYLNFDLSFIKDYLKVAMPVIINVFFWALGTTIYTIIYGITGKNGQGAVQVAMTVQNFFIVFGMSIGNACTFLLANLLGAAKYPKAKSYAKKCLILAGAISIIFGALVMLTADYLIIPFKLEQDVANSALSILKIVAVMIFFKTINFTAIVGVLRSGGDTFFCFLIDLISVWGVGIPLALYGAYVLKTTILWLYILVSCEEFLKSILCLLRVRTGKWLKRVV